MSAIFLLVLTHVNLITAVEESTSSSLTGRIEDNQNTNAGHGGDTKIETAFDWSVIGKSQLGCPAH